MARLYADENFPLPVVEALRLLGHDVLTIYEDGKGNQSYPDESVLHDATAYGRSVLTVNRKHFRRLHLHFSEHGGIISCTYDPDFAGQAQRIDEIVNAHDKLDGQLMLVYRPSL
jgi:hypothetical protein